METTEVIVVFQPGCQPSSAWGGVSLQAPTTASCTPVTRRLRQLPSQPQLSAICATAVTVRHSRTVPGQPVQRAHTGQFY